MSATPAARQPVPKIGALARLSATELLDGYRKRSFTPADVIDEVIGALAETDQVCNVMVTPMFDSARAAAAEATKAWRNGQPAGALAGIPVTVKDLIFVAGVPARGGAPALEHFVPEVDAAVVTALRDAGAIITCKTTTCESGYKLTADSPVSGVTRNPWRLDRTSGGSSGGAAAAVAAGCGPLALGTDGVGSIRRTGLVLRRVRDQAHLRPGAESPRILSTFVGLARSHRSHRPDRPRRCAAARGDRAARCARRGEPAGDAASLRLDGRIAGWPQDRLYAGSRLCRGVTRGAEDLRRGRGRAGQSGRRAGSGQLGHRSRGAGAHHQADRLHRAGGRGVRSRRGDADPFRS